jgi:hypothetical protein
VSEIDDLMAGTRAGLARLRTAVPTLSGEQLARRTASGWTVAATLAHLAFYDDWVCERWRRRVRAGRFQDLPDDITELVNAAGARAWNAVTDGRVKTVAVAAADDVAELLAGLPESALTDAVVTGRLAMIDRSRHWTPHLDEIEAVR